MPDQRPTRVAFSDDTQHAFRQFTAARAARPRCAVHGNTLHSLYGCPRCSAPELVEPSCDECMHPLSSHAANGGVCTHEPTTPVETHGGIQVHAYCPCDRFER